MNFVKCSFSVAHISKTQSVFCFFLTLLLSIYLTGCSDRVSLPSPEGLAEFKNAGPVRPSVDIDRLVRAKIGGGPYRIVSGEVLELTMPTILQVVTAEEPEASGKMVPYVCRFSEAGTITLPVVGQIEVAGKTLSEIETAVIDAYYPEYTVTRPSVFARILEYRTAKVSITGAVKNPGIYELRSDQMSLVALLMEAGGIIDEGATLIRIIHFGETAYENMNRNAKLNTAQVLLAGGFGDENINSNTKLSVSDSRKNFTSDEILHTQFVETYKEILETLDLRKSTEVRKKTESGKPKKLEPIVLPVEGLNIPLADVVLRDGDSVIIERLQLPLVTVVGLINKPGNFPYPPDVEYNLMQALGFAGGLNLAAEPRYATVYRLKPDGGVVSAIFKIVDGSKLTEDVSTLIKPGDIIDVAHTPRTRMKLFLDRVFRINLGTYLRLEDAWD